MTHDEFDKLLNRRIDLIKKVLSSKAKEYATDDRLHNFKRAAKIAECSPAQALKGMLLKHLVSVFDLIDENAIDEIISANMVDEKIGDSINYLILLEALLVETSNFVYLPNDTEEL